MANPKCPYCGEEMLLHEVLGDYFYMCKREGCKSMAPMHSSEEAAYAAAMKRDRARGKWTYGDGETLWTCSVCGNDSCCKGNFCPDCGADMMKEENDADGN